MGIGAFKILMVRYDIDISLMTQYLISPIFNDTACL